MTSPWLPDEDSDSISVLVTASEGLHARPAIKLSRLAKKFKSSLAVRANGVGEWADAKSVVRLMALKVEQGARLDFAAHGDDAREALNQLHALVMRDFDEIDRTKGG